MCKSCKLDFRIDVGLHLDMTSTLDVFTVVYPLTTPELLAQFNFELVRADYAVIGSR